jgi:hypothetical protein
MNDTDRKTLFITNGGSRHNSLTELPSYKETDCSGYYVVPIHFHNPEREKRKECFVYASATIGATQGMPDPDGISLIG